MNQIPSKKLAKQFQKYEILDDVTEGFFLEYHH